MVKSLAYLLPLIYYAVEEDILAVIATHTLTLQEQLYHNDLPFLQEVLPSEFKVEVVKGRSNSLCLRRWQEVLQGRAGQLSLVADLEAVQRWGGETVTGGVSDVRFGVEWDVWWELCWG